MKSTKFITILASALLLLAACGEKDDATSTNTTAQEVASEKSTSAENKTTEEQKESTNTEKTPSSTPATTEDTNDEKATEPTTTKKEATNDVTTASDKEEVESTKESSSTVNAVHKDFLQNQFKTAKNGMTEGVPFESGQSVFEDITNDWGEPTTQFSNDTNYIEYAENGKVKYAFAIGRGDRVYDVRTFVAPDSTFNLSDITFDEIITVLGEPTSIKTTGSDKVLNYTTGKNTLKFVGPAATSKLDHISIFNQAASEPMGGSN